MKQTTRQIPVKQAVLALITTAMVWSHTVMLPGGAQAADDCQTCHKALSQTKSAAESHPLDMLSYHPVNAFDCTDCHRAVTRKKPVLEDKACPAQHGYFLKDDYVQASCSACHESTYGLSGAETVYLGEHLFNSRGCAACHSPGQADKKFAPPLNGISEKLKDKRWLPAWLQGPRSIRPGTMMPDFGMSSEKACRIATFLLSLTASSSHHYKKPDISDTSAQRGAHYFTYRGCRACHITDPHPDDPARRIPSLNDAGTKLRPAWVLMELEDPRAYNPDARIPLIDATDEEVRHIMAYLDTLTLDSGRLPPLCTGDTQRYAEEGRDFVEMDGCFACHPINGFDHTPPPAGNITPQLKKSVSPHPWEDLAAILTPAPEKEGSSNRRMPVFHLTDDEIKALVTFFMNAPVSADKDRFLAKRLKQRVGHEGEWLVYDYGCRNCHSVDPGETPHVATVIERNHLLPPRLVGEGEKVQPQWLVHYLDQPSTMRIWMTMSMPYFYFPKQETRALVRYFRQASGFDPEPLPDYQLPFDIQDMDSREKALGIYRFQHDRCAQCHPAGMDQELPENVSVDDLAIDLLMVKDRLRYEWVLNFLRNPDQFAGDDTRMPFIYFKPGGIPKVPDAGRWMKRVARALYHMETLPEPDDSKNTREVIDVNTFWENY
ncbi:MAG: c-type cytochrome [Thermodesulfobacteriota bacterium]|nr:c-type cytochrome [Thermodesulfobacteriota bacterium]